MIISKRKSEQGNDFLGKWKLFRGTAFLPCACSLRESQRLWVIWTVPHKALQTGESLLLPRLPWLQPSTTQSISFGSWTSGQLLERLHTVLLWSKPCDGFSLRFPDVQWHRFLQCGWGLPSGSSIISLCGSSWVGSVLTTQKQQQCGKVNKSVGGTLPAPGHRRTTCKLWLLSQQIYLEGQDASKVNSSSVADILLLFPQKELASWLIQKQRVRGWGGEVLATSSHCPVKLKNDHQKHGPISLSRVDHLCCYWSDLKMSVPYEWMEYIRTLFCRDLQLSARSKISFTLWWTGPHCSLNERQWPKAEGRRQET